jgi:hypothetical protein
MPILSKLLRNGATADFTLPKTPLKVQQNLSERCLLYLWFKNYNLPIYQNDSIQK